MPTISATPSLSPRSLSSRRADGIEPFLERHAAAYTLYGSGKVALRDGLAGLVDPGENVLLPAYLPDAVVEPFRELGLEPRYYRVQPTFAPDLADVERRIDADTAAVLSVNYFGFPQPGLEELTALIDEYDCYHVDDNAHAPLSIADGRLLGTQGDIGITSLWKLLPVPDGAVLYRNSEDAIERYQPSASAGVRDRLDAADCQFLAKSAVRNLLGERVRESLESLVVAGLESGGEDEIDDDDGDDADEDPDTPAVGGPTERYEEGKRPMSKLTAYVLERADPEAIRTRRRENYRTWLRLLADRPDIEFAFDVLPQGICPQAVPVRADEPQAFLAELERCGAGGAYTWPRLSRTVRDDPAYETAMQLSEEIVALPVHQHVDPETIEAVGSRLR